GVVKREGCGVRAAQGHRNGARLALSAICEGEVACQTVGRRDGTKPVGLLVHGEHRNGRVCRGRGVRALDSRIDRDRPIEGLRGRVCTLRGCRTGAREAIARKAAPGPLATAGRGPKRAPVSTGYACGQTALATGSTTNAVIVRGAFAGSKLAHAR